MSRLQPDLGAQDSASEYTALKTNPTETEQFSDKFNIFFKNENTIL